MISPVEAGLNEIVSWSAFVFLIFTVSVPLFPQPEEKVGYKTYKACRIDFMSGSFILARGF